MRATPQHRLTIIEALAASRLAFIFLLTLTAAAMAGDPAIPRSKPKSDSVARARVAQVYGRLPLRFEANQGQTDAQVKFLSRGRGYGLFLTPTEALLSLRKPSAVSHQPSGNSRQSAVGSQPSQEATDNHNSQFTNHKSPTPNPEPPTPTVVRLKLLGAKADAKVEGLGELPGKSNYFLGNDPKQWRTGVPNYEKVRYTGVYEGVDLLYYGNQGQLEYDWVVAPGADPKSIKFAIEGAENVSIDPNGDLVLRIEGGEVRLRKPVVYQEESGVRSQEPGARDEGPRTKDNLQSSIGNRQFLDGRYTLREIRNHKSQITNHKYEVAFALGPYDKTRPLVIDPVLAYSTYLGGSGLDAATDIAVDSSGTVYVAGVTTGGFPTTSGVVRETFQGGTSDAFVFAFFPGASGGVVYSTYLGGSGDDVAYSIATDGAGNAYVAGETTSSNFPTTTGALQTACAGITCDDAFVAKLNGSGMTLLYSTYFGGSGAEVAARVVVDDSNNVNIAGTTTSTDIVVPGSITPYQATNNGGRDAFAAILDSSGANLLYFTYLGGSGDDRAFDLALRPGSAVLYLTGETASTNFPTSVLAYDDALDGTDDAFVTAIDPFPSLAGPLVFSTYLGGSGSESGGGIAVDSNQNTVFVGGVTSSSTDFPLLSATQTTYGGGPNDIFVAGLNFTGTGLASSTYLGGSGDDQGGRVVVDSFSNIFVAGLTNSTDFPTANPIQANNSGGYDLFLTEYSNEVLFFSTYLGGANNEINIPGFGPLGAITLDSSGNIYAASYTASTDFPIVLPSFSFDATASGNGDAFVVVIEPRDSSAVFVTPPSLEFGNVNVGTTSSPPLTAALKNMGSAQLNFTAINIQPGPNTVSGEFAQSNDCGNFLAGGGACTFTVTLTPATVGQKRATLQILHDAGGSAQTSSIALHGFGTQPGVSLSPTSWDFGEVFIGITNTSRFVSVTNSGTGPLTISAVTLSGPGSSMYSILSNTCTGAVLGVGSNCSFDVYFVPTAVGTFNAQVDVASDAPTNGTDIVTLTGVGVLPPIPTFTSPGGVNVPVTFPATNVGATSAPQTVTLQNTGPSTLTINSITTTGNINATNLTFRIDPASSCLTVGSLAASASCNIVLTFTPYQLGSINGALVLNDNAPGSPHSLALSGTGNPVPFARGEIFISLADGKVERRRSDSSLMQIMDTGKPSYTYGMAFDRDGNLYVTNFGHGQVTKFTNTGVLVGTVATGLSGPESLVFDSAGNFYVSNANSNQLNKYASDNATPEQFTLAVENRGVDWIDLGADQCTMYYTSEGLSVKRFDVCTNTQLDDLTNALPGSYAFALRVLPSGGLLVANSDQVHRLDASGNIIKTYTPTPAESLLFALNLDPDGTSFWTGDYYSYNVYKFDISTGQQLFNFNTGTTFGGGFGITLFGEITVATSPQISIASVNFPGNPVNFPGNCPTKNMQITNNGPGELVVTEATSSNPALFSAVSLGTCATPTPQGQSCTIPILFTPPTVGPFNATITITSNAVGTPREVVVTGMGTPECRLLAPVRAATLLRGTDAQDFAIEDAKPSCSPVDLKLTCSVDNPAACALNPAVIAPSGASTLRVSNLKAVRAESLQVRVNSTSEFRTASELITVAFADFAFTKAPDTATVAAGETATYSLAIRPINGLAGNVALACSGAPRGATCRVEPASVTLDGASLAPAKVRVTTTGRAAAMPPVASLPLVGVGAQGLAPLLAFLLLAGLAVAAGSRRRSPVGTRALQRLGLAALLGAMLVWASCGGGGSMSFNASGTPAGTYTLTITGTYSSSTGSTPGTLTNGTSVVLKVN